MNFIGIEIRPLIWYIDVRNKNEIKNDLQSSQQWDILGRCIRLKISATVEQ